MKILFLGYTDSPLIRHLIDRGEDMVFSSHKMTLEQINNIKPNFIISYGYRHILTPDIIEAYRGRAINLHISYLPYNRGADPAFWSLVENTPGGVTIHELDEGIDTGGVIIQELCDPDETTPTLQLYVEKLHKCIQELFKMYWPKIQAGEMPGYKWQFKGTYHNLRDKEALIRKLPLEIIRGLK